MARLPIPGGDDGDWGQILNDYLSVEHNADGTHKNTGGSTTLGWDVLISINGSTITAVDRTGATINSGTNLVTVFDAAKATDRHIHFKSGSYTMPAGSSNTLQLLNGMTVSGEGYNTVFTRTDAGNVFDIIGTSSNRLSGISIYNVHCSGPSLPSAQIEGNGVAVIYADDITVEGCYAHGFGSKGDDAAFKADKSARVKMRKNVGWASKNGFCTGAPGSSEIRVSESQFSNNEAYSNYDDGFHSQRGSRNRWDNNIAWGHPNGGASDGAGFDFLGEEYSTMINNVAFNNGRGMEIGNTAERSLPDIGDILSDNILVNNTEYGLTIIGSVVRSTLSNNIIENNGTNGVRMGSASVGTIMEDVVLSGNQIHNNGSTGVDIFGYVTRPKLIMNFFSGHTSRDIYVRTSTGTPSGYALIDNETRSTTGITDNVNDAGKIVRLFGA